MVTMYEDSDYATRVAWLATGDWSSRAAISGMSVEDDPATAAEPIYMSTPILGPWERAALGHPENVVRPISEAWLEDQLADEWVVAARVLKQGDAQVIAELRIFPGKRWAERDEAYREGRPEPGYWEANTLGDRAEVPAGGLTYKLVRGVKISRLLKYATDGPAALLERLSYPFEELGRRAQKALQQRRGRPPLSDADYAAVVAYRSVPGGTTRKERAKALHMSDTRLRDVTEIARRRGFGIPVPQGKRGLWQLTPKGARVLEEDSAKKVASFLCLFLLVGGRRS